MIYWGMAADPPREKIDLHTHTTASDGSLTPTQLVEKAASVGIGTLSITDHDTVAGLEEGRAAAQRLGVRIIPGVEFGTNIGEEEIHMLGYLFDPAQPLLAKRLQNLREGRVGRAKRMVEKLNAVGVSIAWERVAEIAKGASVGRPHVARVLIEAGHAASVDEAFEKYLWRDKPAYVPRDPFSPEECISFVHEVGGVAVLAHPTWVKKLETLLPSLVRSGLDGIETYYGRYNTETVARFARLASKHGLVPTGGSDYHGFEGLAHAELGSVSVPPECLAALEGRMPAT